jgi:hypothetical protein
MATWTSQMTFTRESGSASPRDGPNTAVLPRQSKQPRRSTAARFGKLRATTGGCAACSSPTRPSSAETAALHTLLQRRQGRLRFIGSLASGPRSLHRGAGTRANGGWFGSFGVVRTAGHLAEGPDPAAKAAVLQQEAARAFRPCEADPLPDAALRHGGGQEQG